jgi:hypothetical protein
MPGQWLDHSGEVTNRLAVKGDLVVPKYALKSFSTFARSWGIAALILVCSMLRIGRLRKKAHQRLDCCEAALMG